MAAAGCAVYPRAACKSPWIAASHSKTVNVCQELSIVAITEYYQAVVVFKQYAARNSQAKVASQAATAVTEGSSQAVLIWIVVLQGRGYDIVAVQDYLKTAAA